jgi:hypothetical protein
MIVAAYGTSAHYSERKKMRAIHQYTTSKCHYIYSIFFPLLRHNVFTKDEAIASGVEKVYRPIVNGCFA